MSYDTFYFPQKCTYQRMFFYMYLVTCLITKKIAKCQNTLSDCIQKQIIQFYCKIQKVFVGSVRGGGGGDFTYVVYILSL